MGIRGILSYILFILMCLCTLFITSSYFVDEEVLPKWYTLYFLVLFACILFLVMTKSINFQFDNLTIFIFSFVGYLLFWSSFSCGMSTVFQSVVFLLLFLLIKLVDKQNTTTISIIIIFTCSLQAIYGILQFAGIINSNSLFEVVGSFGNPAGFAASLSVGYVFCCTLLGKKKYFNYISVIVMSIIGVSILLSQSRAGIISIFVTTAIFLYHKFKHKLSRKDKKWILSGIVTVSILLGTTLLLLKKDSAIGRLLIWKTTANIIIEKPILGWGSDSFRAQYMLRQADYFKNNLDSRFELLGDNVTHPFNECLLLIVEYGIVGLLLLLALIFTIYRKRNKRNFIFQLCIFSILVFACFSYPLRYPFVWLILAYCLAKLSNNSTKIYYQWNRKFSPLLRVNLVMILCLYCCFLIKDIQFEYKWKKATNLSLLGKAKTVMSHYEELHTEWNGNPLFLYNYGALLNYIKRYDKSVLILHECEKYYNDYDVQMLLADNYLNMKQWNKSEIYYTNASFMCPNRFLPLCELMNVYDSIGQTDQSIKIAYKIINKSMKIQSHTIYSIKFKAKKRLNNAESEKQ